MDESKHPSLDYRVDGSWRISPPELQGEFIVYLATLGRKPGSVTPQQVKALFERFAACRTYRKTAELEQIGS
jgi:hypothetical protein